MPNFRAYQLRDGLLNGSINASTLETRLTTVAEDEAAFIQIATNLYSFDPLANIADGFTAIAGSAAARSIIVASPDAIRAFANSDYGTEQLCKNTNGVLILAEILKDLTGGRFSHWRNFSTNYQRIKTWVNASGSKLKRNIYLSSGTWTAPAITLAWSSSAGGGAGSGGASTVGAGGGGGGEIKAVNLASGIPSSNQTVTIGAGGGAATATANGNTGAATTVGSLISSAAGAGGQTSGTGGIGGGTTTGRGWRDFTDVDLLNAPWQCINASQKGGDGGTSSATAGENGFPNSGGRPSIGATYNPGPGINYGGGGGGADANAASNGTAPSANFSVGSSGADNPNSRAAGSGFAVVHHLEA